jgi:hypothetical protein
LFPKMATLVAPRIPVKPCEAERSYEIEAATSRSRKGAGKPSSSADLVARPPYYPGCTTAWAAKTQSTAFADTVMVAMLVLAPVPRANWIRA